MNKIVLGVLALIVLGVFFWQVQSRIPETQNAAGEHSYNSSELGISFRYQDGYEVEKHQNALVIYPGDYIPPANGEGAPAITLAMYDNPEAISLDQWVRTDARSNFQLSADKVLETRTVDGEEALEYRHSGLYETDAVAVAHGGKIYVFSVGWMTPQDVTREQFQDLLPTVEFTR